MCRGYSKKKTTIRGENVQTIIIKLNAGLLENPDTDLRYVLPERIEEFTSHLVSDNGYDYLSSSELGIWLETEHAEEMAQRIAELMQKEKFCQNDLSLSAEIYISSQECAELEHSQKIYP